MKTKLLLLIAFIHTSISAQGYNPLVVEGNRWNHLRSYYENTILNTHSYELGKDSLIDNINYKKLTVTIDSDRKSVV